MVTDWRGSAGVSKLCYVNDRLRRRGCCSAERTLMLRLETVDAYLVALVERAPMTAADLLRWRPQSSRSRELG